MQQRYRVATGAGTSSTLKTLLGLNVLVYVMWTQLFPPSFMGEHFLLSARHIEAGNYWTIMTTAFSHYEFNHLLFNMIALWVFGREVEQVIGSRGLLRLYIMGALIASLGHLGFNFLSYTDVPALGASGAVMAIAVQYGALFPKRVLMINFFIPIPAAIAVAGYVLLDVWGMFSGGDGIAHAAHLGGAVYGLWHHAKRVRPYLQRG